MVPSFPIETSMFVVVLIDLLPTTTFSFHVGFTLSIDVFIIGIIVVDDDGIIIIDDVIIIFFVVVGNISIVVVAVIIIIFYYSVT